jgi:UDP-N-acetylmuramoyl-L-alanyl-D-glutamate--2,6-diaminopimelate ligase
MSRSSILNADSPWSEKMGKGLSFGIDKGDLRAQKISFDVNGARFSVNGQPFTIPLMGRHNIYNAMAAIALGVQVGADLKKIAHILAQFGSVPGRLERVGNVFVDFAHTGEALENALKTLKEICKGKIIAVFGCGGQRDPERRVSMAKAAEKWADISIITTDNPRQEDPNEIVRQIICHFKNRPLVELDRKIAIEKALKIAESDDFVLIAGKGHEKMQILAHQTIPFDDAEMVKNLISSSLRDDLHRSEELRG